MRGRPPSWWSGFGALTWIQPTETSFGTACTEALNGALQPSWWVMNEQGSTLQKYASSRGNPWASVAEAPRRLQSSMPVRRAAPIAAPFHSTAISPAVLPNERPAKMKALALIKANAIYAVSCYTSRRIFSAHFLRTPALLVDEGEERAWCEAFRTRVVGQSLSSDKSMGPGLCPRPLGGFDYAAV